MVFAQVTYAVSLILLLTLWIQSYILFTITECVAHLPRITSLESKEEPAAKAQGQKKSSSLERMQFMQYYQQEAATLKLEAQCKENRLCLKAELVLFGCNLMECLYCLASERGPVKHCGRTQGLAPVLPLLGPLGWR